MVNRGEEKVRVHMNVVPRSTGNSIDIMLVFSSFKIGNMFGVKNPIPRGHREGVVYIFLFVCADLNARYVGGSTRNFSTRVQT